MDEQRAGRQLHRCRSRVAALIKTLEQVRDKLVPSMHAEDPNASEAVALIDKALKKARSDSSVIKGRDQ